MLFFVLKLDRRGSGLIVVTYVLCVFLAGAACTDLMEGRVSNFWLLGAFLAGLWLRGMEFLWAAAIVLIPGFFLFHFRMMGAGDGKMMGVMAGFLGMEAGFLAIFLGLLIGGFWGFCRMVQNKCFRARLKRLFVYGAGVLRGMEYTAYDGLSGEMGVHRIPLAACLAAGGYLYLFASGAIELGGML